MPIKIPDSLPARSVLAGENIFVMTESIALHQDFRPLQILILNLMPTKISTETQLLRCLSNTPLQIEITLLQTSTHKSRNTPEEHLLSFYTVFDDIKDRRFDGMIVTGAPVEHMEFADVDYWDELTAIFDWSAANVFSTYFICWGAQAALKHFYGVGKIMLPSKLSGIYAHAIADQNAPLARGFDEQFLAPHSRHTGVDAEDIERVPGLEILSASDMAGLFITVSKDGRQIFVTGHPEYDRMTLSDEYRRDLAAGRSPEIPYNYFPGNDPQKIPPFVWRSHAHLLFTNWLNYYVYQETPYDLTELG